MPLSYQEISDLFHEARAGSPELLGNVTLPKFAEELNRTSGTQDYSAGLSDNWIKRTSASLNRGIEWTGAPEVTGGAFAKLAGAVGVSPETGYRVGRGLPRAAVNFAPLVAATAAAPFTGGGSLIPLLGLGGTAALSGAETYTESGSPAQGLITAGTTLALPAFSRAGGQLALKAIGTPITEGIDAATGQFIRARLEKTLGTRLASYAGGQAGAFTDFELAHQAASVVAGEGLQNPLEPENVFATVAGQLPFMVADIPRVVRATPQVDIINRTLNTAAKVADAKQGMASVPDIDTSGEAARNPDLVKFNDIVANKVKITQDETLTPEQKAQRLAELDKQEAAVVRNQAKQKAEDKADLLFDEPVKPKEVTPSASKVGETVEETSGVPTPAMEPGTEGQIRLRDTPQDRLETATREATNVQPIVEMAKTNVIAPVVDLPTAVDKVKVANETNIEVGGKPLTNADLESKADAIISGGEELTPAAEKVTQAVASESVDRADVVQRVTQRTLNKRQGQADAMAYMAEAEKKPNFPKDIIDGWLQRSSSLTGGQVDRYTNDVAAVYQNWNTSGQPGGIQGLNARLSVALQNATKPLPLETRTLKNDGTVSSAKGGRGLQSRQTFDTPGEAVTALNAAETKYLDAIPEKSRGKDTSVFTVRKVKGQEKFYVEQRIYPRAEALYEGHTPEVDRNALSQAEQDDVNTHIEVTDIVPDLINESKGQDAQPELKQSAEVVKASVGDFAAALRFAPEATIHEIIGFGTKDAPTTPADVDTFRTRVSTIVESVGTGHNDPEFLNDRLTEKGVSFETPEQLTEFMDSSNFITALGVARDLVHEQTHPHISLDAVGALFGTDVKPGISTPASRGGLTEIPTEPKPTTELPILQPKPFGLLGGLTNLLEKWYKQAGLTDMQLQGYVTSSLRVAAMFRQLDDARVGEIVNNARDWNVYGLSANFARKDFPGAIYLAQLPKDFGDVQTRKIAHKFIIGHELWHSLETQHELGQLSPEDTRVMNNLVDHLEDSDINERRNVLTEFFNELLPKWAQTDELRNMVLAGADSASETRANLGGILASSLTEFKPRTVRSLVEFLPKPIGDFISTAIRHMKRIVSSISGAQVLNDRGLIEPITNEFTHPGLNEFTTGFLALTRQLDQVDILTQRFMELQNLDPSGFRQLQKNYLLNPLETAVFKQTKPHTAQLSADHFGYLMGFNKEPKGFETELTDKKSLFAGVMQSFSKFVNPALQFAEANPSIRPAVWLPMEYLKQGHDFTRRSLTPFSGRWDAITGEITFGESLNHLRRMQTDTVSRAALDKIQLWQNDNNKPFVKEDGRTFEDPSLVDNLSHKQLEDVISTNLAIRASNEINQQAYLNFKKATLVQRLAQTISGQNPSWKPNQAKDIATNMLAATEMLGDPTKVAQAQEVFRQLQTKLVPEQFIALQQFTTEGLGALGELKKFYDKHPEFTSERRYGGYATSYLLPDGSTGRVSGRSQQEVDTKLGQISNVQQILEKVTPETVKRTEGLSQGFIDTAQKFEGVIKARMQQILGDAEFDKIKDISFSDPLVRELAARQLGEKQPYRRGASGRETLDMLENHLHYTNALTRSMGSHYIQNELALLLKDPELAGRDDLKLYARQHVANFLAPDSPAGRALVTSNFLYYMGMNISTTMMESVQSFFSLVPTLIREGGGILNSYRNTLGAARKIGQWAITKSWDNPEHTQLMERAGREHNIQLGSFSEFLDPEEHGAVNISRLMYRKDPATMSDIVTKPIGQFSQLARSYYSIFTNFNHRIALISAFDHFRSQGMEFEEAYENANRVNHVVNFSGGRAARPVGWFQPSDPVGRTAAQGLYSLMSYQFGMISMMGRYLREGFGPVREGVSPWQRTQARQAAVVMLGTQLAAAGALGMPAVGTSIAVLEQIFPELQLNKKIREEIASLGGDDQELGAILSDMSLHGVVNQIGGVDLGSRFALGNILGTSNYDGFSVENFLGPTGNLLKNMAMGVQQTSQGDLGRAAQSVIPQGFKRIIDLTRNDWTAKDQRGNLLLQPTLGEKFAMMIGFSPTRVTQLRDAQRIMQRSQQIERNDIIRLHQDFADRVREGDYQGVRQSLLDKTKVDPTYDPRVGAREIADIVANKTLPVDLRRMGAKHSAQDDSEILRTYALTGPPPSETQRLQIKQGIMARLGLGSQVTPSQVQEAGMTDQLQLTDPTLMRSAAKARVSRLLHRSSVDRLPQLLALPTSAQ